MNFGRRGVGFTGIRQANYLRVGGGLVALVVAVMAPAGQHRSYGDIGKFGLKEAGVTVYVLACFCANSSIPHM